MTVSEKIVEYALQQVGGPYIYGATAKDCTPSYRRARIKQYPDYEDKITRNCPVLAGRQKNCSGCKHDGQIAHDCAQLTRYAAKAAGLTLPSGATSQWRKGDWASQGEIDALPADKVAFVYRKNGDLMQHTGVYLGDGTVVDARGHDSGVVHGPVGSYKWTHWAILKGMDGVVAEPDTATTTERSTVRRGDRGEAVKDLQRILKDMGYNLEVDGIFGPLTKSVVESYQGKTGLTRDGIVGPKTWAALESKETDNLYTVTIKGLTAAVAEAIIKAYGGSMEGGDANV